MTFRTGYRVRITNSAPLTGSFSDANPATGYSTFSANVASIASGDVVPYYAWDGASQYEEGYLTYTAGSPASLSRTVVRSTNSNLACNFTDSVYISCGIHDDNVVMTDNSHLLMAAGSYNIVMGPGKLSSTQNMAASAWTTSGIREQFGGGTLTDQTSSGTVAAAYTSVRGGNTIAASNPATFTNYFELYVKRPIAGTNVTLTNGLALGADSFAVGANVTAPLGTAGVGLIANAFTQTDSTTGVGTVANAYGHVFNAVTMATAVNAVTISNAYGAYFTAPVAGAHVTFSSSYALGADSLRVNGPIVAGVVTASAVSGSSSLILQNASLTNKNWAMLLTTDGLESDLGFFYTGTSAGTKMTLGANGCLGIGMSPVNILDITQNRNGTAYVSALNNSSGGAALSGFYATNGTHAIQMVQLGESYTSTGVLGSAYGAVVSNTYLSLVAQTNAILFAAGGTTELARIAVDAGNPALFVGCTSTPSTSVHGLEITSGPSNGGQVVIYAGASTGTAAVFGTTSGQAGSITTSGTTTTYGVSSGADIKDNIVSMSAVLAIKLLRASEPSTYIYKADGSIGHGFVVEKAHSNAQKHGVDLQALGIVRLKTDKYGAVMDYGKWTPYLACVAVDHEDRITELEAANADLCKQLAKLKKAA